MKHANTQRVKVSFEFVVVLLAAILVTGVAKPASAFRMIQNATIGTVTEGLAVPCNDPDSFVHWIVRDIDWRLNPANKGSSKASQLSAALGAWTTAAGSQYNLGLVGTTNGGFAADGVNTFRWSNNDGCDNNCNALTALTLMAGQVIVESDITFNNSKNWGGFLTSRDVQGTATHEVGHSLGIHHSDVSGPPEPTMLAGVGTKGDRTLEQDDRDALACSQNTFPVAPPLGIRYRAHVQGSGWLSWVVNGQIAGTTGQGKRMEAAQLVAINPTPGMAICYRAHVKGQGWLSTVCNGATGGTTGQNRRMEAIQITASNRPPGCNLQYRAHVKGIGWLGWVQNGATAGTTGQNRRMEALQVRFVGSCP